MANKICIGNTAHPNASGTWDWTFFVRPAEYIAEVTVTLHPTFKKPVHKLQGPTLELSCSGWGTFELKVDIQWKGGGQLNTTWMLRFDECLECQTDFYDVYEVPAEVISRNAIAGVQSSRDNFSPRNSTMPDGQGHTWCEVDRPTMLAALAASPALNPGNDPLGQSWHGRLVQLDLARPRMTWESQRRPREDKHGKADAPEWLNASEYKDDAQVLAYKVRILANLLRRSERTLAYTGAGLSVDAGIEMAAAGRAPRRKKKSSPLEADPTVAHCIMAELNKENLLHGWVQQNHDGLPQKAGYRQEDINEIHGSWYDPSNPVVLYSGSLRNDLCSDMRTWAKTADLVLVLGTSLSGLNADQCVTKTAGRSLPGENRKMSLGSVIISPQRTPEDGEASLRIFATADEVMTALAGEFGLQSRLDPPITIGTEHRRARFSSELRVKVPYDRNGKRSDTVQTWWDLSPGSKLTVSKHNNIAGAEQPDYLHITPEIVGVALSRDRASERACCISIRFSDPCTQASSSMQLGLWWIDAAIRGGVKYLPVVNVDAVEEPVRRTR